MAQFNVYTHTDKTGKSYNAIEVQQANGKSTYLAETPDGRLTVINSDQLNNPRTPTEKARADIIQHAKQDRNPSKLDISNDQASYMLNMIAKKSDAHGNYSRPSSSAREAFRQEGEAKADLTAKAIMLKEQGLTKESNEITHRLNTAGTQAPKTQSTEQQKAQKPMVNTLTNYQKAFSQLQEKAFTY